MTPIDPPNVLVNELRNRDRFLLVGHMNPDGDSIGSALGLARLLTIIGKSATLWNRDPTPAVYRSLPGADRIHVGEACPVEDPVEQFDVLVAIECPTLDRSGLAEHLEALPALNIDHHLGNQNYGIVNWVDAGAPALGEMILRLARALGMPLDPETATMLLVALVSDTGGFRFANATPRAFEAGGSLVSSGADPTEVSRLLYESRPKASLLLLREMLATLELDRKSGVASVLLTGSMFDAAGATSAHSEGLIDYPRSIDGVQAVVLVREIGDGECKVSLRSRGDTNVEAMARKRGGGGHKNAAGFVAAGEAAAVRAEAVRELQERIRVDEE